MTKTEMTPRQRVAAALSHEEPDRVPIDFGSAAGDSITLAAYRNLLLHLGLPERPIQIKRKLGQNPWIDEDVLRRFRVDFRGVGIRGADGWKDVQIDEHSYVDEWGVARAMPPGSHYYDLVRAPFAEDDTLSAIEQHHWPDPYDPGRYRGLREDARRLHDETDFAVVLDVNTTFFLPCGQLRGWENFYMDLVANVPFAEALMDRVLEIRLAMAGRALEEAGEYAEVVVATTDDLAMIDRPLISPALYRALVKPRQKKALDFIMARTAARRFCHCDGAVASLIPDLLEIGMEALNPIQVSAVGMEDTRKLKAEFGDRLTFWGGIDTREVLPKGTPQDVREEVRRRILDLGPGGGYVLCAVHNFQPEVPPENIVAMYDAAYELGQYPLP